MPTAGFVERDGVPYFVTDDDDDGGFTQTALVTAPDVTNFVKSLGSLGALCDLSGFRSGTASGLIYSWITPCAGGH